MPASRPVTITALSIAQILGLALLIEQRGADATMAVLTGLAALNVAPIALLIRYMKI